MMLIDCFGRWHCNGLHLLQIDNTRKNFLPCFNFFLSLFLSCSISFSIFPPLCLYFIHSFFSYLFSLFLSSFRSLSFILSLSIPFPLFLFLSFFHSVFLFSCLSLPTLSFFLLHFLFYFLTFIYYFLLCLIIISTLSSLPPLYVACPLTLHTLSQT